MMMIEDDEQSDIFIISIEEMDKKISDKKLIINEINNLTNMLKKSRITLVNEFIKKLSNMSFTNSLKEELDVLIPKLEKEIININIENKLKSKKGLKNEK